MPTPRRVVVNFAKNHAYPLCQDRLARSLDDVGFGGGRLLLKDYLPGWPTHEEDPYAFKIYAIDLAISQGFDSILWLDSRAWAVRPIEPFFEAMEAEGHYLMHGGARMDARCTDECLARSGLTRDEAAFVRMLGGSIYGLDLRNPRTRDFLDEWRSWQRSGLFKGPAINEVNREVMERGGYGGRTVGLVSTDSRVVGHAHDEACASFIAHRLGMTSVHVGREFGGYSPEFAALPTTYFVSQGM